MCHIPDQDQYVFYLAYQPCGPDRETAVSKTCHQALTRPWLCWRDVNLFVQSQNVPIRANFTVVWEPICMQSCLQDSFQYRLLNESIL